MTNYSERQIFDAIRDYRENAETKRQDAAHNGAYNDGGASAMEEQAQAFVDGWTRKTPDWLEELILKAETEEAAERAEYERLKRKYK